MGKGRKIYSNDSGNLLFFVLILSVSRLAVALSSKDLITNLAPQYRAFSMNLN